MAVNDLWVVRMRFHARRARASSRKIFGSTPKALLKPRETVSGVKSCDSAQSASRTRFFVRSVRAKLSVQCRSVAGRARRTLRSVLTASSRSCSAILASKSGSGTESDLPNYCPSKAVEVSAGHAVWSCGPCDSRTRHAAVHRPVEPQTGRRNSPLQMHRAVPPWRSPRRADAWVQAVDPASRRRTGSSGTFPRWSKPLGDCTPAHPLIGVRRRTEPDRPPQASVAPCWDFFRPCKRNGT